MGFLGLIPATELGAFYDPQKQQLILSAKGDAKQYTAGISFYARPEPGELQFELMGWVGPLGPGTQPYEHSQPFRLHLPSPAYPSGTVRIFTANHPEGVVIDIHWGGLLPPAEGEEASAPAPAAAPAAAAGQPAAEDAAPVLPAGGNQRYMLVTLGVPFQIRQSAKVPPMGTVTEAHDPAVYRLLSTHLEGGDIVWTFQSLRVGTGQIVVTVTGGIATYIIRFDYQIQTIIGPAAAAQA